MDRKYDLDDLRTLLRAYLDQVYLPTTHKDAVRLKAVDWPQCIAAGEVEKFLNWLAGQGI